jgi:hypothetical protein
MLPPLYLIPILNALFGWLLVKRTVSGIFTGLQKNPHVLTQNLGNLTLSKGEIEAQFEGIDWVKELDPLIDKRLDSYIEQIKQKIPMAGMFLSGEIVKTLKGQGKEEIYKMIPELKSLLAEQIATRVDVKQFVQNKVAELDFNVLFKPLEKTLAIVSFAGAVAGFILGCIEVFLVKILS